MKSIKMLNCRICGDSKLVVIGKELFDDRYGAPGKHSVIQCVDCGYVSTYPGISKSEIGRFYAKYYPHGKTNSETVARRPEIPSKLVRLFLGIGHTCHWYAKSGEKVLDIGCGTGRSLVEIKGIGANAYGVEPDPSVQKIAKQLELKVWTGFITDNPFPGQQFDLITASQVIEHDPNPIAFFKAVRNKLAPKGRIIISTPNIDSIMRKFWGNKWLHWHIPYHLSFFSKKTFYHLAAQSGLKVTKIRTITPNLWAILQWKTVHSKSKEGTPNELWSGKKSLYTSKIQLMTTHLFAFMLCRLLDLVGQGESIVVTLERE